MTSPLIPRMDTLADKVGGLAHSVEGWRERAMKRVAGRQKGSQRSTERKHGMYLFMDDEMKVLLDEVAMRRDISMTGYARRAVAAMIAHDLGLPFEAVVKHSAKPTTYKQTNVAGPKSKTYDDGKDAGNWEIGTLR